MGRTEAGEVTEMRELEGSALDELRDPRLAGVLHAITTLSAEIVAALAALRTDESNSSK